MRPPRATCGTGAPPGSPTTCGGNSARRDHRHRRPPVRRRRDVRADPRAARSPAVRRPGAPRRPARALGLALRAHHAADARADARDAARAGGPRQRGHGALLGADGVLRARRRPLRAARPGAAGPRRRRVAGAPRDHARREERGRARRGGPHPAARRLHPPGAAQARREGDDGLRHDALRGVPEHRGARGARRLGGRAGVQLAEAPRPPRRADRRERRGDRLPAVAGGGAGAPPHRPVGRRDGAGGRGAAQREPVPRPGPWPGACWYPQVRGTLGGEAEHPQWNGASGTGAGVGRRRAADREAPPLSRGADADHDSGTGGPAVINHIDVSMVLRGTVCDLYSNLVTRSTGAAVRGEIEAQLAELRGRSVNVIDFSHVTLLDFSCADEIVAKLLLRFGVGAGEDTTRTAETPCAVADDWNGTPAPAGPREAYFVFRGVSDVH